MTPRTTAAADPGTAVRLRAAEIGYGDVPIVRGADLVVGTGEAVAVLGANGSGKTTLIRGLLGLATVLGGSVEVLGEPVGRLHERGRVGYVPQRHTVSGAVPATVREVVTVGRLARRGLLARLRAADRAAVAEAVDAVGLADRLDSPVAALSGGQQRRVLVARALAAQPELLVMDEPTAGVDAASQEALGELLGSVRERGTTLVIATHEIAPMAGALDRAVEVDHGQISYDGPLAGAAGDLAGDGHHHAAGTGRPAARGYRVDHPRVLPRAAHEGRR